MAGAGACLLTFGWPAVEPADPVAGCKRMPRVGPDGPVGVSDLTIWSGLGTLCAHALDAEIPAASSTTAAAVVRLRMMSPSRPRPYRYSTHRAVCGDLDNIGHKEMCPSVIRRIPFPS